MSENEQKKKVTPIRVTGAPDPPIPIGGGYVPPKDQPANWEYWNRFLIVSIHDAIYLTIGIKPKVGDPKEQKNRAKFSELYALARSHLSFGSLKLFPNGNEQVQVSDWLDWLPVIGEKPHPKWQPIDVGKMKVEQAAIDGNAEHNEEDSSSIEFKIAEDIYNRLSDDPSISDIGGGTMIFDYLTNAGTLKLDDGTEYFLRNENPYEDQRKDVGNRKYDGVTIHYNVTGKLQKFGIRKLVDAFALRKKQEIPQ